MPLKRKRGSYGKGKGETTIAASHVLKGGGFFWTLLEKGGDVKSGHPSDRKALAAVTVILPVRGKHKNKNLLTLRRVKALH